MERRIRKLYHPVIVKELAFLMCHFITATLAPASLLETARSIAQQHGRAWESLENPHVTPQLRSGEAYFLTTRKHCDCGTSLGSRRSAGEPEPSHERRIEKLRGRGWSEARIQRWLREKREAERRRATALREPSEDSASWATFLRTVLDEPRVESVGLLLHWYATSPASERIRLARHETVDVTAIEPAFLERIEEDILYRFRRGV